MLEGVAAAGGRHQHRIEGVGPRRPALADHRREGGHQVGGQLAGLGQLALVVGHRAAAALVGGDHHLDAVGAEHLDRRRIHGRIKEPLHAAQHQPHPVAPLPLGGHHHRQGIAESLGG